MEDKIIIRDESPRFSIIHHALADSGLLAEMSGSDLKGYVGLKRFANFTTQRCYPSIETLVSVTGLSRGGLFNVIKRLINFGLITRESGGGRGNANEYTLTTPDKWKRSINWTVCVMPMIERNGPKIDTQTVQKLDPK
jgi:hypothetical protein